MAMVIDGRQLHRSIETYIDPSNGVLHWLVRPLNIRGEIKDTRLHQSDIAAIIWNRVDVVMAAHLKSPLRDGRHDRGWPKATAPAAPIAPRAFLDQSLRPRAI